MGAPIIGASIVVEYSIAPNTIIYSSFTHSVGDFTVTNIPLGSYYLRIFYTGYREEYYNSLVYLPDRGLADLITLEAPGDYPLGTITLTYTMCNDGLDSDGWGDSDVADPSCSSIDDSSEFGSGVCDNGVDDDGDTYIDKDDIGCSGPADTTEYSASIHQCDNGIDDDIDGLIDSDDPSCYRGSTNERSPDINVMCGDGIDNDSDLSSDYSTLPPPNSDSQCTTPFDYSEYPPVEDCGNVYDTDADGELDPADPACIASSGTRAKHPSLPCDDGLDNDGDGYYDYNPLATTGDPGCSSPSDTSEKDDFPMYPCDDGIDNDGDGLVDFPDDTGCGSVSDGDEVTSSSECDNGTDDDGDGYVDYQCNYGMDYAPGILGIDDDGDTIVDNSRECGAPSSDDYLAGDPGCLNLRDPSENQPGLECDDGIDNDGDTYIDIADPSCYSTPWCDDELMGLGNSCSPPP